MKSTLEYDTWFTWSNFNNAWILSGTNGLKNFVEYAEKAAAIIRNVKPDKSVARVHIIFNVKV